MVEIFHNKDYFRYNKHFAHNEFLLSYDRNMLDKEIYDFYIFQDDIFEFLSISIIKNRMAIKNYGQTKAIINFDDNVLDSDDTSLVLTHGRKILDDSLFPQNKDDFMILLKNIIHLKKYKF